MENLRVIDVSEHQGTINWDAVKGHIDGAILRCGYGDNIASQDDKQWKRNADECTRLGIPFGVYIYSYATSDAQAKSEAEHVLRMVSGYKLSYPIYLDLEQAGTENGAIQRANIFGDIIEKAGYWCGVYANTNWWTNYLVGLERFVKWVAQYNSVCTYQGTYDIWQYTSGGSVPGISGNVDMNHCYRDYPAEITGGDTKPTPPAVAPSGSTLDLVVGVMQGKYGDGDARKNALGNRYNEVQNMINYIASASVDTLVKEVYAGKYGNGDTRKAALGNRYNEVQNKINGSSGGGAVYYTVQSGDTLSGIAAKYGTNYQASVVKEIIRSHMDEVDDDWIPCSEQLPEESGHYLVQLSRKLPNEDYSDRVVVLFNGEEKEFMSYASLIIAWQPLPEPYKEEKKC